MDKLMLIKKIIQDQNIHYTVFQSFEGEAHLFDLGLRNKILVNYDFTSFGNTLLSQCSMNTLLFFRDTFLCHYACLCFRRETKLEYLLIGPYLSKEITQSEFYNLLQKLEVSPALEQELQEYYNSLPKVNEMNRFHTLLSTLSKQILSQDINLKFIENFSKHNDEKLAYIPESDLLISHKLIEERYQAENEMLHAIAQGDSVKAIIKFEEFIQHQITPRFKDPIRHLRNLTIVFNTLCRKTVESCNVHPFHIDKVSRNFAIQIESLQTIKDAHRLQIAMIRKYCLLVTNYSLTGYSPIIQKVINHININISESLSLNAFADLYSINASYLSTLFKKELGITITEYIHSHKIQLAIKLLNTSNMQIQDIASAVGFNDVNYFIKIFKKIKGMTPKEYRDSFRLRREL